MPQERIASFPVRVITARALIARINRKLAPDMRGLRTARGARDRFDLGHHYVIDFTNGGAVEMHVDVEDLGRELGVLADYERIA
jgi:hypothetical protein